MLPHFLFMVVRNELTTRTSVSLHDLSRVESSWGYAEFTDAVIRLYRDVVFSSNTLSISYPVHALLAPSYSVQLNGGPGRLYSLDDKTYWGIEGISYTACSGSLIIERGGGITVEALSIEGDFGQCHFQGNIGKNETINGTITLKVHRRFIKSLALPLPESLELAQQMYTITISIAGDIAQPDIDVSSDIFRFRLKRHE